MDFEKELKEKTQKKKKVARAYNHRPEQPKGWGT